MPSRKKALVEWDSGTSAVAGSVTVVYVKQSTADIYIFKSHITVFVILMYIPLGLLKRIFSFSHWTINFPTGFPCLSKTFTHHAM